MPDLDNSGSTFYTKQTGTYNRQSNPSGCISGSNLATQTQRHEIGLASSNYIESHWGEYRTSLNKPANNFGTIIEGAVGPPSQSQSTFENNLKGQLNTAQGTIHNDFNADPYGVDYDEYDVFLGTVNWAPTYNYCH